MELFGGGRSKPATKKRVSCVPQELVRRQVDDRPFAISEKRRETNCDFSLKLTSSSIWKRRLLEKTANAPTISFLAMLSSCVITNSAGVRDVRAREGTTERGTKEREAERERRGSREYRREIRGRSDIPNE